MKAVRKVGNYYVIHLFSRETSILLKCWLFSHFWKWWRFQSAKSLTKIGVLWRVFCLQTSYRSGLYDKQCYHNRHLKNGYFCSEIWKKSLDPSYVGISKQSNRKMSPNCHRVKYWHMTYISRTPCIYEDNRNENVSVEIFLSLMFP